MKKTEIEYLGISKEAQKIFDKVAKKYPEKIDIDLDFGLLAIYAEACIRYKKYTKMLDGKGPLADNGKNMINPILTAISMQEKKILQCAAKLGLSPDSRHKIKLDLAAISKSESGTGRRKQKQVQSTEEQAEDFC